MTTAVATAECVRCGFTFDVAPRRTGVWRLCPDCRKVKTRRHLDTESLGYQLARSVTTSRLAIELAAGTLRQALHHGDLLRIRHAAFVALEALDQAEAPARSMTFPRPRLPQD